ncbi:MAG: acetyl-CoA carboxylase carboxyltransferase subunit alpha [Brevinematales bacterium]|nr:acetyl-CoA carboxylase carboxyltransferase subunit alpha [Brevinematales bacterium]
MDVKPLSFETPIVEMEKKIEEMKNSLGLDDNAPEIKNLYKQLEDIKNKVYSNLTEWQIVEISRHPERPTFVDYLNSIFKDFIELAGDRYFGDDKAIIAGFGKLDGKSVCIVGQEKGKTVEEKIKRNFGMPHPEGYRKALRVMKLAERFRIPVITFIDTAGAYPGVGAEERGQGEAIARNLFEMSGLKTPLIGVVISEGGSGGALAIGVVDRIFMLEYAIYSVISPEGCASILWKDASKAPEAAKALKLTAKWCKEFGIVDKIIKEPLGGAHRNPEFVFNNLKSELIKEIDTLSKFSNEQLIKMRYSKFRNLGVYEVK